MEEIILNRLQITGVLDETTPYCVVKEVLEAHNLSSNKIDEKNLSFSILQNEINKLNSYRPITLMGSLEDNIRYLATFVNPNCKTWTKRSLLKAYEHLINFPKENPAILINISYCQKDRDNIEGYNACMLYSLCKNYGIDTNWKMNCISMTHLLQKLSIDTTKLRMNLAPLLESLTRTQLVNIYGLLEKNITRKQILSLLPESSVSDNKTQEKKAMLHLDQDKLIQCHKNFTDINYLLISMNPKNHYEAIILSGLVYRLNISESKFPLQEYEELSNSKNIDIYVPIDNIFRKKFFHNKTWYNLSHHWCSELSFLYSEKELKQFCIQEGYDKEDFRSYDALTLLHMSRISLNIYLGKNVYDYEQDITPIDMDTLSEIPNFDCLTLGILNEPISLKTYSIKEISNVFVNYKNYVNPENQKEALSEKLIRKIQSFSSIELQKAINVVEKWKQYSNEYSDSLRKIYLENKNISTYLYKILESGMFMRGWKVISEKYPLNENSTKLVDSDMQFKLEENVFSSIREIQEWIESDKINESERKILKDLPLMKFSHEGDTKIFIVTPDPDDGTSMYNRLEIVLDGNKHKNMKSCIRLSSNILLYSVYFYLCALGLPEPFNIFELEHIT